MSRELAKTYEPQEVEDRIYKFWTDGGYFHAKVDPEKKTVYDCDSPAEYYGAAAYGPRLG